MPIKRSNTYMQKQWEHELLYWVNSLHLTRGARVAVSTAGGGIYMFNADGELLWDYEAEDSIRATAVVEDASCIAAGTDGGEVLLLSRSGELIWSHELESRVSSVSVPSDGSFVAAGAGGWLYVFSRRGKLLWSSKVARSVDSVSASANGSCIAVGARDLSSGKVCLFDRHGDVLWEQKTGWSLAGSVKVAASQRGMLIAAGWLHGVRMFDAGGECLWYYETGGSVEDLAFSPDGNYVVAGTLDGAVYLFSKDGMVWSRKLKSSIRAVGISEAGCSVAALDNGFIYLFDREGEILWEKETYEGICSIDISRDGLCIAAGSEDGVVYMFSRRRT